MRAYRRLRVRLRKRDLEKVDGGLSGGIQAVRVVLRALALCQLHEGKPVSEVASSVRLTPKAVREIGRRYEDFGLEQALYDKQRPRAVAVLDDSQRQRIIAIQIQQELFYAVKDLVDAGDAVAEDIRRVLATRHTDNPGEQDFEGAPFNPRARYVRNQRLVAYRKENVTDMAGWI